MGGKRRTIGRFVATGLTALAYSVGSLTAAATELLWSTQWSNWTTVESVVWTDPPKDLEIADDFDLTATVERVIVGGDAPCTGACFPVPEVLGVHVRFYEWTPSGPGALQYESWVPAGDPGFLFDPDTPDQLDVTLSPPFESTGQHFISFQLSVNGSYGWTIWVANHNTPSGSPAQVRDNLAGGVWGQIQDWWGEPLNDDVYFELWGSTGPGGEPGLVAECGTWEIVPSPNPVGADDANLNAVEVISPWDAWAVGNSRVPGDQFTLAMHWNGARWLVVPSPNPAPASGLEWLDLNGVAAVAPNDVWAVGQKNDVGMGGFVGTHVMALHWDGSDWAEVDLPEPGSASSPFQGASGDLLLDVEAIGPGDVWMVGKWFRFLPSDAVIWPGVALRWNGSSFDVFEPPFVTTTASQQLNAVSGVAPDDVWAVGSGGGNASYIFHFDGSTWSHVPGPTFGTESVLLDVVALASNDVWAGGYYRDVAEILPLMLHWDGVSWSRVVAPQQVSSFSAQAADNILAVGQGGVMHWDGNSWSEEPAPEIVPWGALRDLSFVGACEAWGVGSRGVGGYSATLTARLVPATHPADDVDGDGVLNLDDNCPDVANPDQADCDLDGRGDVCELIEGTEFDCNGNFTPDSCESFSDCNVNDVPDECEPDCNGTGTTDECDIAAGSSPDCNLNGVPDECDNFADCNTNGVDDVCDIGSGDSTDANRNGYPDECEALEAGTATVTTIEDIVDFGGGQQLSDLPGPDGLVSMREAVVAVNSTPGHQSIAFNIPPERWQGTNATGPELRIEDGLFILTDDGTTIDFDTQTAFTGDTDPDGPEVRIYGFEANAWGVTAILIAADGCTVKGIGRVAQRGYAVQISGNDNRVIGSEISGPIHAGIYITGGWEGPIASGNVIGGGGSGEGNWISGGDAGVRIDAPAAQNVVVGNVISGGSSGVQIRGGATGNRIGGPMVADRNVISGAGHRGSEGCPTGEQVEIWDSDDNVVLNNWIGLNTEGTASVGQIGVYGILNRGSSNTVIRDNVVSGILAVGSNHCDGDRVGEAIAIEGLSRNVLVEGNVVGADASGLTPIVNRAGIKVDRWPPDEFPTGVMIRDNQVANSELWGVMIGSGVAGATITRTEISDNGGLGIDLSGGGGNDGQVAPALNTVTTDDVSITISGTLGSSANETYRLEFFGSSICDDSGAGEGERFLGSELFSLGTTGMASFEWTIPSVVLAGEVVTATATALGTGNTSAFSTCATAIQAACSAPPPAVREVRVDSNATTLIWMPFGPSVSYDVARGTVTSMHAGQAASCISPQQQDAFYDDLTEPAPSETFYYLIRARIACGVGTWGDGGSRTGSCP